MTGETTLTYTPPGYAAINLDVVQTQEFTWNPVVDARGKLMYYAVTLRCFCVLNDVFQNPRRVGQNAVNALKDIQHGLNTPRGTLVLTIGGVEILRSPAVGYTVDCANGPFVLDAPRVFAVHGYGRSLQCQVSFQTFVNRCRTALIIDGNEVPTAIISHTWSMRSKIDADSMETRVILGRMVFRSDVMTALARVPDDYRILMTHPLATNFKRVMVDVIANDDGNSADYMIIDKQMARNILEFGVGRIEGVHTINFTALGRMGMLDTAAGATFTFIGELMSGIARAFTGGGISPPTFSPFGIARALLPGLSHQVIVRVWGQPQTTLGGVSNVARRILAARVAEFLPYAHAIDFTESRDLVGQFVEIRAVFVAGLSAALLFVMDTDANFLFPVTDNVLGDIVPDIISCNRFTSDRHLPPNSNGMRGTESSTLVAQALVRACETPPSNQPASLARRAGDFTS